MFNKPLKLTKAIVADAQPGDKEYILWDSEVRKLGLRILPSGRKSYIYQYRIGRLSKKYTIGAGDLSLPVVRSLALEAAAKVAKGIDPGKERDDLRNAITIAQFVEQFDTTHITRVHQVLEEMAVERIEMPSAIAAVRLLMFTGCRLNEIMKLQWRFVDLKVGVLRLPDSKTGPRRVQLGEAAIAVLESIKQIKDNPWVLTGRLKADG